MDLRSSVTVDGVDIRFDIVSSGPAVVLVHGGAAHHVWWYRVVDQLAERHRVVLLDLSGHGRSGHRERYRMQDWGREVGAVIQAADAGPAILVGHSLGARIAIAAAVERPEQVERLVLLDANLRSRAELGTPQPARPVRPPRVYASRQEAIERFRLVPDQDGPDPAILVPLAEYSAIEVEGGWAWGHDWSHPTEPYDAAVLDYVSRLTHPVTFAYGTASRVSGPERARQFADIAPVQVRILTISDGEHLVMLDQPEGTVAAITA